jgi:predicted acylesterase/phospholipase RssA
MTRDLAITFAGGGNRAFYQLGLMNRWREHLLPRVAAMATCSAGACVAVLLLSGREGEASLYWKERRKGITKNFEWRKLLSAKRPTPHEPIYRDTLLHAFMEGGMDRIRSQPFPVLVLATAFPKRMPAFVAVMLGLSAYNVEKRLRKEMIHPSFGQRLGFKAMAYDARDCETPEELTDLIISSSATPPFTSLGGFKGQRLLDGGIIDNVPAFLADEVPEVKRNLVLLTRPYASHLTGRQGTRLYIAPDKTLPVNRWDYTRPELIDATIEQGERDAKLRSALLDDFLN